MKDIIEFPVVGTRFTEGGLFMARLLKERDILELVPEPENPKDPNAIKVMAYGDHVGYVPNQGISCSLCWTHVGPVEQCCSGCGADWTHYRRGGLATRLLFTKALERPFACFVKSVDPSHETLVLSAKLILE